MLSGFASFRLYRQLYTVRGFNLEETKRDYQDTSATVEPTGNLSGFAESCQPGSEEFNRSFQVAATMFPDDPIAI